MSSGIEYVLGDRREAVTPPAPPSTIPPAKNTREFWLEFVRVETDRFLLIGLIVFLHFVHASDTLQATALGGLVMTIQAQRYKRT